MISGSSSIQPTGRRPPTSACAASIILFAGTRRSGRSNRSSRRGLKTGLPGFRSNSPVGSVFIPLENNPTIESLRRMWWSIACRVAKSRPRASGNAYAVIANLGQEHRLTVDAGEPLEPLMLDGAWSSRRMPTRWSSAPGWRRRKNQARREAYAAPDADTTGWLPMVIGAWSYQLPAEPDRPYPIDVWYRISFTVERVPRHLQLIVDGFAGSGWEVFVNGEPVTGDPVRSAIDSQMQALEITPLVHQGENVIAVRLTVTKATDGLLDLVKLMGDFAVERVDGSERIGAPRSALQPASWVDQGVSLLLGSWALSVPLRAPDNFADQRIFLEPEMRDDTLEVLVNDQRAAVRLWEPYEIELTDYLKPGDNTLELQVANTPINLLKLSPYPGWPVPRGWFLPAGHVCCSWRVVCMAPLTPTLSLCAGRGGGGTCHPGLRPTSRHHFGRRVHLGCSRYSVIEQTFGVRAEGIVGESLHVGPAGNRAYLAVPERGAGAGVWCCTPGGD